MLDEKNRGFGFVEYELIEDAHVAIDNMHLNVLEGRTLKCSIATKSKSFYENESTDIPGNTYLVVIIKSCLFLSF